MFQQYPHLTCWNFYVPKNLETEVTVERPNCELQTLQFSFEFWVAHTFVLSPLIICFIIIGEITNPEFMASYKPVLLEAPEILALPTQLHFAEAAASSGKGPPAVERLGRTLIQNINT